MNRSSRRTLLVVTSFSLAALFAGRGYAMIAVVSPNAQPPAAANAQDAAKKNAASVNGASAGAASGAKAGTTSAPNAASLTRPSTTLSTSAVPPKAAAAPARSTASRASPGPISPGRSTLATAPAPRSASWMPSAATENSMRKGTVEAFNPAGAVQVYGQKLTFNPGSVKVFTAGKPGSVYTVKTGASIRFTLDPTDAKHRRIAVIYVN